MPRFCGKCHQPGHSRKTCEVRRLAQTRALAQSDPVKALDDAIEALEAEAAELTATIATLKRERDKIASVASPEGASPDGPWDRA
jgi:hypothetical protein